MSTSKDHIDYWKARLRKQKARRESWEGAAKNQDWEIYIQHRGIREWFNLRTPNRDAAAATAREIRRTVVGAGWDAARAQYKPEVTRILKSPTVGEYLQAVRDHSTLKTHTFEGYARKLRTLVSGLRNMPFDRNAGGYGAWTLKIESTKLTAITAMAVQQWKKRYLTSVGESPVELMHAKRTINSILRNCKSLFTPKLLSVVPVDLQKPVPFDGVSFESVSRPRYRTKVDVTALISKAEAELKMQDREAYKVFLLALAAGLRRKEIDGLTWSQVNCDKQTIHVETTSHTALKSEDSEELIDLPSSVAEQLRRFKEESITSFVIAAAPPKEKQRRYPTYRCNDVFVSLISWLRAQGIVDRKPIHLLRKEFGSYIAAEQGIFAASHALRHADISTTRTYYIDKKAPIVFSAAFSA